jgi:hypothetical protein
MDDFSRCVYARFYLEETARNQCDFLMRWWSPKENPLEFPAHGLFSQMYFDCGPINMSAPVRNTIKGVGTYIVPTSPSTWEPYGSRKHGKPERVFRTLHEYFKELPDILPMHFDELQVWLYYKLLHYNNRVHSVTKRPPFALWSTIARVRQAPAPEIFAFLSQTHEERTVTKYLEISVNGNHYHIEKARLEAKAGKKPVEDLVGKRVQVFYSFDDFTQVTVALPGFPDLPLPKCDNPQCHATATPDWSPTTIELKRKEVAAIDTKRRWQPQGGVPTYLPREGATFDETKVATKFVVDASGNRRPTHEEEEKPTDNWATAAQWCMRTGIFSTPPSALDKSWIVGVVTARGKIGKEEILEMARQYKADQGVIAADVDIEG